MLTRVQCPCEFVASAQSMVSVSHSMQAHCEHSHGAFTMAHMRAVKILDAPCPK